MKEQLRNFFTRFVIAIKTPVGLTLLGAGAGSLFTHLFELSKKDRELQEARKDLKELKEKVIKISDLLSLASDRNISLLADLRESDKYGNRTRADLEQERLEKTMIQQAFGDSFCFYRRPLVVGDSSKILNAPSQHSRG